MAKPPTPKTVKPTRPAGSAKFNTRMTQKIDTRERIRRAAWELFTTVGYEKTTTKDVALRAKVASGTVFIHASDKQDLLMLAMHDRIADYLDVLMSALPTTGGLITKLVHIFRGLFQMHAEHVELSLVFSSAVLSAQGQNAKRMSASTFTFLHQLGLLVQEAQREGEVAQDVDPMIAAGNLFSTYFMSLMGWLGQHTPFDIALEQHLKPSLMLQFKGLRAR